MRNIIKIAVALLIMATAVPVMAQEWEKVDDTTYVRRFIHTDGVLTDYAEPVDMTALTMKINNDLRSASLCQFGCMGSGAVATAAALINASEHGGKSTTLTTATVIFGIASVGLGIASVCKLYRQRVYMAPDGVVIRITRTDKPKYNNKKRRGLFQ